MDRDPRPSSNLVRAESSGLLSAWVQEFGLGQWNNLLAELENRGMLPIDHGQLQQRVEQLYLELAHATGPHRATDPLGGVDRIQTADELATARWAEPADLASRHVYRRGDLWVGRCPQTGVGLGYRRKNHVLVNAVTRQGKGATLIIPNHILWEGSLVSIDPKGENATVTAARRGQGNDFCVGLKQQVYVLDPMNCYRGDDKYRARYNPLDLLDPTDPRVAEMAATMADAMVVRPEGEKEPVWNDTARSIIKGLLLHVCSAPQFEGRRNLATVYKLAMLGDKEAAEWFEKIAAEEEGDKASRISPFDALYRTMTLNEVCGPASTSIQSIGNEMLELRQGSDRKTWSSFRRSLLQQLEFLESPGIQDVTAESDFSLSELKTSENGMSLFLCLPDGEMPTYSRWLRLMINLVLKEHKRDQIKPACGHETLLCLDEFETLGHDTQINEGFSRLAGYHVKLLIVTQFLQQLKHHYEKNWHSFIENVGLRMVFGVGPETAKEVSSWLGEKEVRPVAQNRTIGMSRQANASLTHTQAQAQGGSTNTTITDATNQSTGQSHAQASSETFTNSTSQSATEGHSSSHATGTNRNETHGQGTGQSVTNTKGQANTEGVATGEAQTASNGTSLSETQGNNSSRGGSNGASFSTNVGISQRHPGFFGIGRNESFNQGEGTSESWTNTWNQGQNYSRSQGTSHQDSHTRNKTLNTSQTTNLSRSVADTTNQQHSVSNGTSNTRTQSVSGSQTHGSSQSTARGTTNTSSTNSSQGTSHSEAVSNGTNWSNTASQALNQGLTAGHNIGGGASQSIHKRPLITAQDLEREFMWRDPGEPYAPGFVLAQIAGERPAVVQRTTYYDDLQFDARYDRHPSYPESDPQPLIRQGVYAVPIDLKTAEERGITGLFWYKKKQQPSQLHASTVAAWHHKVGDSIEKGEPLYSIRPGLAIARKINGQVAIHAPFKGTLKSIQTPIGKPFADDSVLATVEYHIEDLWDATENPAENPDFDRYIRGDHPIMERHRLRLAQEEAEREAKQEAKRLEKEAKRLEYEALVARLAAERKAAKQAAAERDAAIAKAKCEAEEQAQRQAARQARRDERKQFRADMQAIVSRPIKKAKRLIYAALTLNGLAIWAGFGAAVWAPVLMVCVAAFVMTFVANRMLKQYLIEAMKRCYTQKGRSRESRAKRRARREKMFKRELDRGWFFTTVMVICFMVAIGGSRLGWIPEEDGAWLCFMLVPLWFASEWIVKAGRLARRLHWMSREGEYVNLRKDVVLIGPQKEIDAQYK